MTEDNCPRVSSAESDSSTTKQRKRRKWDQPDESLVSAGLAVPGIFPLANVGSLARITLPAVSSASGISPAIPFSPGNATLLQAVQVPLQQHAAAIVQKLVLPKIQEELVAREIVINDADSAIRYKLTKRQTQEEIQRSTGAVVITRGKYQPPNVPPDGERPLYLHISAAAHLETTAERTKAVDHAAAIVEEMLKQATVSSAVKVGHLLNTCVYLGFEADPSLNIVSRIRGPNDQYVNHIMNETGATVLLRGRGSGFSENGQTEETLQPLHLLLVSKDAKSLERAKLLAENLLDTISAECGKSRVSSCKVYGAVPPPPQLQPRVDSTEDASKVNNIVASTASTGVSSVVSQSPVSQSIGLSKPGLPPANTACYPHGLINGTSYNGYGGIYPQATPLQQVALVLKQSTSPATATVAPATTARSTDPPKDAPLPVKDNRPQKRKFQELPTATKLPANPIQKNMQGSEFPMPRELTSHVGARDIPVVLDQKKSVKPLSNEMPPPPPKSLSHQTLSNGMPSLSPGSLSPHPPPPKFNSMPKPHQDNDGMDRSKPEVVPDTLIKLMEYGDDDDDDDGNNLNETTEEALSNHSSAPAAPKPFWAV